MNFTLSDEDRDFKERFEGFCQEKLAPKARLVDQRGWAPDFFRENLGELANFGFLKLFHPKELGGLGANGIQVALAIELAAKACASSALTALASTLLAGKVLAELGRSEHHKQWLLPIMAGEKVAGVALAEDAALSDERNVVCTLSRGAKGYVVNGRKSRFGNAPIADVVPALVRTDPKIRKDPVINGAEACVVVIDTSKRGVERYVIDSIGARGMPWGGMNLDNVKVDEIDVLSLQSQNQTLISPISRVEVVEWGGVLMSNASIGVAEAAFEETVRFCRDRTAFGMSLGHLQAMHARLADMRVQLDAARLLAWTAAMRKVAKKKAAGELCFMAKVHATDVAESVCVAALRLHGGWGFAKQFNVERLYRDCQAFMAAGGANDRLRDLISGPMVGVDTLHHNESTNWLTGSLLPQLTRDIVAPEPASIVVGRSPAAELNPPTAGARIEALGTAMISGHAYLITSLSKHGALLSGREAPPIGDDVHVQLEIIEGNRSVEVDAKVIKAGPLKNGSAGFVISFVKIERGEDNDKAAQPARETPATDAPRAPPTPPVSTSTSTATAPQPRPAPAEPARTASAARPAVAAAPRPRPAPAPAAPSLAAASAGNAEADATAPATEQIRTRG